MPVLVSSYFSVLSLSRVSGSKGYVEEPLGHSLLQQPRHLLFGLDCEGDAHGVGDACFPHVLDDVISMLSNIHVDGLDASPSLA